MTCRPRFADLSDARIAGRLARTTMLAVRPDAILALAVLVIGTIWVSRLPAEIHVRATAASEADGANPTPSRDQTDGVTPARRLREGAMLVDELGRFEAAGERLCFVPSKGDSRYLVLENLNLERVAQAVGENVDARQWSVSGTITEYRGSNYLLVTRAILKSRSRGNAATP